MKFTIATTILPLFLARQAVGICPGFNFGIGNVQRLGNGINRCKLLYFASHRKRRRFIRHPFFFLSFLTGNVYDDSCNQVDGLTTTGNPCTNGIFGCSPPPITFNRYTSTFTGLMLVNLTFLGFHQLMNFPPIAMRVAQTPTQAYVVAMSSQSA
jgi:hypothetical protein